MLTDWRGDPPREDWSHPPVSMAADLPTRTSGVDYADGTTQRRLSQIGADVVTDGDRVTATPPSWRPDLRQPADLVEEVLRLEGLEIIPSVLPQAPAGRGLSPVQKRRRAIGKSLALNGYVEVLPTPFLPAGVFDQWGLPADDPRRDTTQVLNPLESDRPQLATTLLPGLLEALGRNVSRGAVDVALFAIAQVVESTAETRAVERIPNDRRPTDEEIAALDASLPRQPQHVAVVLAGLREPAGPWGSGRRADAIDAFEAVRVIGRAAGVEMTLRAAHYLPWHPGRCAEVVIGDTVVGHAGQLHPAVVERSGLPKGTCAVELDLDAIPITEAMPAPAVSPFPAVFQDVSLIVGEDVAAQTVVDAVRDGAGELLEDVRLFDVYTGPQIGDGRKSVTLALRFRATDRTLTEDEASAARDAAVKTAADRVGAVHRA
jgi:phenylalanyl-tRNA synthetase beta chain